MKCKTNVYLPILCVGGFIEVLTKELGMLRIDVSEVDGLIGIQLRTDLLDKIWNSIPSYIVQHPHFKTKPYEEIKWLGSIKKDVIQ